MLLKMNERFFQPIMNDSVHTRHHLDDVLPRELVRLADYSRFRGEHLQPIDQPTKLIKRSACMGDTIGELSIWLH